MFKLLEIEFIDHPFFNSLSVKFVSDGEEKAENYTTLIIGPNGTGKSQILLAAINIFNSLENTPKNTGKKYTFGYRYTIHYTNNGSTYKVEYNKDGLFINGDDYRNGGMDFNLPSKVLVSAFSFNDKYPLRENRGKVINENYYYLGLKSTNNNIFIFNPPKIAIVNLCDALLRGKDILPLKEAFTTLELKPEIKVVYETTRFFKFLQNNEFWENKQLTTTEFSNSYTEFVKSKKRKSNKPEIKRLGNETIEKTLANKNKIQILIDYLRDNIRIVTDYKGKVLNLKPHLDFDNPVSFNDFIYHIKSFQILSDLGLISLKKFDIKKLGTNFSFDDASSGEYHIILTYLNILSLIEENSIVLIDEPEISLHPNWQIKYMDIFNKIFHHFPKTHFIIASHSHFLVSDLKSSNSNILGIDVNEEGKITIIPTEKNTYGWSAEQILLDVFKVATTRNYFITKIVTDVLKELSKEKPDYVFVKEKLSEVIFLDASDFKEHDPLKDIFSELTKLYNEL